MLSIGVDIGGTKLAAGVVDEAGSILRRVDRLSPSGSARETEDAIVDAVGDLTRDHAVVAVGLGAAGWVDLAQTSIRFSPHLAWRDEPIAARLRERLPMPVLVDNDANVAAWAEYTHGAGRGARVMVLIALGTGIGGALVAAGEVFRGAWGMAGEWGHTTVVPQGHWCACGNRGCWEMYSSGNALVREAEQLIAAGGPRGEALARVADEAGGLTGPLVTRLARQGDHAAGELIADVGTWLGLGLANLAAGLDPDVFVVGGGVCAAGDMLLGPARAAFARTLSGRGHRPVADIRQAGLRNDAGIVGAADLARRSVLGAR
ncbi:MAG: ROK family glucokinase [Propionibacteriaceae bacterium]|nr:ROK family glucokinase [Propionibacteriaceae bacterium]